jgi:hypothetical protein
MRFLNDDEDIFRPLTHPNWSEFGFEEEYMVARHQSNQDEDEVEVKHPKHDFLKKQISR